MSVEPVPTPNAPPVAGPYSPAVRAGDWLVLAGQVGLDPETGRIVERGAEAQARQVLANIAAVLGDCRASLTDVAKTTVFVTDIAQFAAVNAVYADAFSAALTQPTLIFQGMRDASVDYRTVEAFARTRPNVTVSR